MANETTETQARELVAIMRGDDSLDVDDRSLAELWRDNIGTDPEEAALGVLDELTQNDAVAALVSTGSAAVTGATVAMSALSAVGASASVVPVVGWCVAAAVVVANTLLSVVTNGKQLAEGRRLGRQQLKCVNEISFLIDRPVQTRHRQDWGDVPFWEEGADPASAWWHLRASEVASVLASNYMEEGLSGHYRHGFLLDVETDRSYEPRHRDLNEGFPYIDYGPVRPQIELSSGAKKRTRYYGRGAYHIEKDSPFLDFWAGSGPKLQRRMSASLGATQLIRDSLTTSSDPRERRGMLAALMIAAQSQYESRGSRFFVDAPEDLEALVQGLSRPITTGYADFVIENQDGAPPMNIVVVREATPFRMHVGRADAELGSRPGAFTIGSGGGDGILRPFWNAEGARRARTRAETDGLTKWGVFAVPWVPPGEIAKGYLVGFHEGKVGGAVGWAVTPEMLNSARQTTANPSVLNTLPDNHPGTAWLQATFGMWHAEIPVGPTASNRQRFPMPYLWRPVPGYDLDAGGFDRAGEDGGGLGFGAVLAAGAAAYLYTRS